MPIYEYICPQCKEKFTLFKDIDSRHKGLCPECGSESSLIPSLCEWKWFNPFTKDGPGFTSEIAHPDKLKELQKENRRK